MKNYLGNVSKAFPRCLIKNKVRHESIKFITLYPGADPELLLGRGANSRGGGRRLPNILIIFFEKPMKLKKFWSVGGGGSARRGHPLDPPLIPPLQLPEKLSAAVHINSLADLNSIKPGINSISVSIVATQPSLPSPASTSLHPWSGEAMIYGDIA